MTAEACDFTKPYRQIDMCKSCTSRVYLSIQLTIGPLVDLASYDSRETTRTAHLRAALEHLGWSKWTPIKQG